MHWLTWLIPWQPSPTVVVATLLFATLYWRGGRRTRSPLPRRVSFWAGLVLLYAALHTRLDYYAEREFFVHRLQHMVLHDVGPFLIALAEPGATLLAGLPASWRKRWDTSRAAQVTRATFRSLAQPLVVGMLFVGAMWLWLIPDVQFYAMLDVHLYRTMNWSTVAAALLFWTSALDSRSSPPARFKRGTRILLLGAVMPPAMAAGGLVTLATANLYPLYELCGRAFAGITALEDQTLGGLILWVPGSMMCVLGALIELWFWFRNEEAAAPQPGASAAPRRTSA
ncbi:MAG TPA: cytochrome c oxidase assembly protein [Opitutus sp.]|nr:cytochrome c oxidase assembly protein [Opitutus sp.]